MINKKIDTKINLCDTCIYDVARCKCGKVEFEDGEGMDNIIKCEGYQKTEQFGGYEND